MCFFKVKTPSVTNTQVSASQLVPETTTKEPESPVYGGTEDAYKRKGRDALKIKLNTTSSTGYNPVNM